METEKKIRQDAWSSEDDLLLAETVLRHIREGSTQLAAFEEVGNQLNRTPAACGFRWNSTIRKQYEEATKAAKLERKQKKKQYIIQNINEEEVTAAIRTEQSVEVFQGPKMSFGEAIEFLRQHYQDYEALQKELEAKNNMIRELQEEMRELKRELKNPNAAAHEVSEDYQTLIKILDRARKMSILS